MYDFKLHSGRNELLPAFSSKIEFVIDRIKQISMITALIKQSKGVIGFNGSCRIYKRGVNKGAPSKIFTNHAQLLRKKQAASRFSYSIILFVQYTSS